MATTEGGRRLSGRTAFRARGVRPRSRHAGVALLAAVAVALVLAPVASASTSSTSLSASSTQLSPNQQVTLTATVTTSTGSTQGTVAFTANSAAISGCSAVAVTGGQATCVTSFSQPGTYGLQANYSGDHTYGSWSTSNQVNVAVSGLSTSVTLSSSTPSPTTGLAFILTAAVSGSSGDNTPVTGTVAFLDGGTPIPGCTAQGVSSSRQAQCQLRFDAAGSHTIVAQYSGDSHWTSSMSAPLNLVVRASGSGRLGPCAGQDQVFSDVDLAAARRALLCVINAVRGSYGLDPVSESAALDAHAQAHPGQSWAPPGVRIYGGSVLFQGDGPDTPYAVVAAWMHDRHTCFDLLSPRTEAGFGAVNHPVILSPPQAGQPAFGYAPAWTALMLATSPGTFNQPATSSCPHPLPVDAAGQGKPRGPHQPVTDLLIALAAHRGPAIALELLGQVRGHFAARLTVTVPGGASRSIQVRGPTAPQSRILSVRFGARALRGAIHNAIVRVHVTETSPKPSTYLFELRL